MNDSEQAQAEDGGLVRIEKAVYGGDGLARTAEGAVVFVPFALPGELVSTRLAGSGEPPVVQEPSPDRVTPACVHFGVCGGCQYQMASYEAQLALKAGILEEVLERAGVDGLPPIHRWGSPEPYGYRNRIRLRVHAADDGLRLGYHVRGTKEFLPVVMCPIAAPVLWNTAEAILRVAQANEEAAAWVRSAAEVELLCNEDGSQAMVHLLCPGPVPKRKGSFERFGEALARGEAAVRTVVASRLHPASGRALEQLAAWGTGGLPYRVGEHRFWLQRGTFFQVNRFLLPRMVALVCGERRGALAWDLFAGVGLFARELARRFDRVTAVEANAAALDELRRGLRAGRDTVVGETTLAFLRGAVLQRDRPQLVVLDPPRAGAGEEACRLLLRLQPEEIVYVSCDPTTLARDLSVLGEAFGVAERHMLDLFPQTYHLETVMVLRRRDLAG